MANSNRRKVIWRRTVHVLSGPLGLAILGLLRVLPPAASSRLMESVVSRFAGLFINKNKVRRNFLIAMPELSETELRGVLNDVARTFGRVLGELPHLQHFQKNQRGASMSLRNPPDVSKGPVVLVGAHFSNWEIWAAACAMTQRPTVMVYSAFGEAVADREMTRMRTATGLHMVERNTAVRDCMRAISGGKNVGLVVDHRVDSGHVVPFFGRMATFPHLPARLAIRFGRPIVAGWPVARGRVSYDVHFGVPMFANPDLPPDKAEWELTARMAAAIESIIRENPGAWFCATRRWPQDMVQ